MQLVGAALAKGCGGQLIKPLLSDVIATDLTEPIAALLQAGQRHIDLAQFINLKMWQPLSAAPRTQRRGRPVRCHPGQSFSLILQRVSACGKIHLHRSHIKFSPFGGLTRILVL